MSCLHPPFLSFFFRTVRLVITPGAGGSPPLTKWANLFTATCLEPTPWTSRSETLARLNAARREWHAHSRASVSTQAKVEEEEVDRTPWGELEPSDEESSEEEEEEESEEEKPDETGFFTPADRYAVTV